MRIGDESQFYEHETAQLPFNVTCPTRESAERDTLSGTPDSPLPTGHLLRVSGCSQSQPQGKSLLSLRLASLTANLTRPAVCAMLGIDRCACDTRDTGQTEQDRDAFQASAVSLESHRVTSKARIIPRNKVTCARLRLCSPCLRLADADSKLLLEMSPLPVADNRDNHVVQQCT
jgi:hypothetical protein